MPKLILPNGTVIESDNANDFLPFVEKKAKPIDSEEPRIKRRYTKRVGTKIKWTGEEIELLAQNLSRPISELMRMLPARTSKAIYTTKSQLQNNHLPHSKQKVYTDFLNHR